MRRFVYVLLLIKLMGWHWQQLVVGVGVGDDHQTQTKNVPVIFNVGDSNSDTGGFVAGFGIPVNPPYGRSFFHRSTGRVSDGRLVLDFLCQSLNISLLGPDPYLESLGSNFQNGANFAVSGSTTLPRDVPFSLNVQVMQFIHFKARSLNLAIVTGSKGLIDEEGFQNALYMIDIGQNDLGVAFSTNLSYSQVVRQVPSIIAEIKDALKTLYDEGGRKFWIHNTGPLGCLPYILWQAQPKEEDLDTSGCILSYNHAAQRFNEALLHLCQEIQSELVDATIVYVDIYSIKYDIISNATSYGFSSPLMACCGAGGPPYNFDKKMICSHPGSEACTNGSQYISWDGVHYTEAANTIVANKILSRDYSTPTVSFDFFFQKDEEIDMDIHSILMIKQDQ